MINKVDDTPRFLNFFTYIKYSNAAFSLKSKKKAIYHGSILLSKRSNKNYNRFFVVKIY